MTALDHGLVPRPAHVQPAAGAPLDLADGVRLQAPESLRALATVAAARLSRDVPTVVVGAVADASGGPGERSPGAVTLRWELATPAWVGVDETVGETAGEAYELRVGDGGVVVTAPQPAGLLHGTTVLGQLIATRADRVLPALVVRDRPRYAWRGLSVDVARHPLPVADLLRLVDLLVDLRMNVLHLHLTDDQGWRLHVPSRPLLTERSGGTAVAGDPGGFLTEADWDRLVAHAAERCVEVVPEVDSPGHVNAALHAYGELTPDGVAPEPYTGIEVGFSRLSADLPSTQPFLADVLGDVVRMTPGRYVHIGGDEVLTMAPEEYVRLVRLAADVVEGHGRTVVAWQEAAVAPLTPGTVVQWWDERPDPAPLVAAARAGARLLLSPASRVYLDMKYDADFPLGLQWAGLVPLARTYDWDPATLLPGVPDGAVVGVEAAVWSETTRSLDDVTTLLLPRLAAAAEVAWTPQERRDWSGFVRRLPPLARAWDRDGLRWHPVGEVTW